MRILWFSSQQWGIPVTGIFWDYENVPLRHKDWQQFLAALNHFAISNHVDFARVYARKKTITQFDREAIRKLNLFDFKWVKHDDPNAADYSLIRSCLDILGSHDQINHVLLLSGDGDFLQLIDQLQKLEVAVTLICQRKNYSKSLINEVHRAYTVDFLSQAPSYWWIYQSP